MPACPCGLLHPPCPHCLLLWHFCFFDCVFFIQNTVGGHIFQASALGSTAKPAAKGCDDGVVRQLRTKAATFPSLGLRSFSSLCFFSCLPLSLSRGSPSRELHFKNLCLPPLSHSPNLTAPAPPSPAAHLLHLPNFQVCSPNPLAKAHRCSKTSAAPEATPSDRRRRPSARRTSQRGCTTQT